MKKNSKREVLCIPRGGPTLSHKHIPKARTIAKENTYTGVTVPFCHLSVQKSPRNRWSAQQATPALTLESRQEKAKREQKLKGVSLKTMTRELNTKRKRNIEAFVKRNKALKVLASSNIIPRESN